MAEYQLEILRKAQRRMITGNFNNACNNFFGELAKVPKKYYDNIFFSGHAATTPVVVTDINLQDDGLHYTIRNIRTEEKIEGIRYDRFPALTIEVAKNVIGAIEVSEVMKRREEAADDKRKKIESELKKAEERQNSSNEKDN